MVLFFERIDLSEFKGPVVGEEGFASAFASEFVQEGVFGTKETAEHLASGTSTSTDKRAYFMSIFLNSEGYLKEGIY